MNIDGLLLNLFRYNILAQPYLEMKENDRRWFLNIFRQNYYEPATIDSHYPYLCRLFRFYTREGRLPTPSEFYISMKRICFCNYYTSDQDYIRAAEFFMKTTGDVLGIPCSHFYYHAEYFAIEGRDPGSFQEIDIYARQMADIEADPSHIFQTFDESKESPTGVDIVKALRDRIQTTSGKGCGICQEEISNQPAVTLHCGHSFHSSEKECCETGTIFTWIAQQSACPICRAEVREQQPEPSPSTHR